MNSSQQFDPVFAELFAQIHPDIKNTLTIEQIAAIQKAFGYNTWTSQHPLDLRVTLPIPGLRFYMVLLGGPEKRSKQRLQYGKFLNPVWTPNNIIFMIGFLAALSVCTLPILSGLLSLINSISNYHFATSPTSIPWIFDQSECERTGRTWSEGKCWDDQHDSLF